jgi:hypothetical protein
MEGEMNWVTSLHSGQGNKQATLVDDNNGYV